MSTLDGPLYLSEPDTIRAGVLDVGRCVDTIEEVFRLLHAGDYVMGGPGHNSHGLGLHFPTSTPFANMPVDGPDRRFVAMPGYLGGRFGVCGLKWYGSNAQNRARGLPRSVLTVMLNDPHTGMPLAVLSANQLSATRTGAVAGVAARHLSDPDARTLALVGCGQINGACVDAIAAHLPRLRRVVCHDIDPPAAQRLADRVRSTLGVHAVVEPGLCRALADAEVVSVAASRVRALRVQADWFHPAATILLSGPMQADDLLWTDSRIVYDHVPLHQDYMEQAVRTEASTERFRGLLAANLYRLIDAGVVPSLRASSDLGAVISHDAAGRRAGDSRIVAVACGMAVHDIAWGCDVYREALDRGIGQPLSWWGVSPPGSASSVRTSGAAR